MLELSQHVALKVGEQGRGVFLLHLHETDNHGLARAQELVEEFRRHLVVVALVGGDIDDDVGQASNLQQTRHVARGSPGRHVRGIPDDKILEHAGAHQILRDAADLIDVFVQTGRHRFGEPIQRAEEAEMSRPARRAVGAGVGDGVAREACLGIGLGRAGSGQHVDHGTLAGAGPADHGDVQGRGRLAIEVRPNAIAHERRGQTQRARLSRLLRLLAEVRFQPAQVVR